MQTKCPDNSNLLYMFNNNTYTDFTTICKSILISSCIILLIQQNQNVTKLNINWLIDWKRPGSKFEVEPSKPYFIFKSPLLTRNIVTPRLGKYHWQELLALTLFSSPPLSKFGPENCLQSRKGERRGDTVYLTYPSVWVATKQPGRFHVS